MATRSAKNGRVFIQPPLSGIDFSMPITAIQTGYTPFMLNYHIENGQLRKRYGHKITVEAPTDEAKCIPTVIPYYDGSSVTQILVSNTQTTDGTTTTTTDTAVKMPACDYVVWKGKIHIAGNAKTVQLDPSALTYTNGLTYTAQVANSTRKGICVYRERLYVGDGQKLYYSGSVGALSGAASSFDLSNIINGDIHGLATYSYNTNYGLDVLLVIVTDLGEVVLYAGANPSTVDWSLQQSYRLPMPPAGADILLGSGYTNDYALEIITLPNDVIINIRHGYYLYSIRELLQTGNINMFSGAATLKQLWQQNTGMKSCCYWQEKNALLAVCSLSLDVPLLSEWRDELDLTAGSGIAVIPGITSTTSYVAFNQCYVMFLFDLNTGHIEIHSVQGVEGVVGQVRSINDVVVIGTNDPGSTTATPRGLQLFKNLERKDTYGDDSYFYQCVVGVTLPKELGYKVKKINNMLLFSNFNSEHDLDYGINKNFRNSPWADVSRTYEIWSEKLSSVPNSLVTGVQAQANNITILGGTQSSAAPTIYIRESSDNVDFFSYNGLDVLYEEGGEF